jgi:hypothetical protein
MMPNRLKALLFSLVISAGFCAITSCHHESKNKTFPDVPDERIAHGRELAKVYCQSCHVLPDPSLADANTWLNSIMPQMGPRLGIFRHAGRNYPSYKADKNLSKNFYPAQPVLSSDDWEDIVEYYAATSPDSLRPQQRLQPMEKKLPFFKLIKPPGIFYEPATSFLKIDTINSKTVILAGDAVQHRILRYNSRLLLRDSLEIDGPVVEMRRSHYPYWVACDIGILNPNNGKFGKLISLTMDRKMIRRKIICDSLQRPVQVLEADLDKDGKQDYLVCEFGNMTGALSWLQNTGNDRFVRHVLKALPGAIKAVINDYNHDGLPDIWCLFAQGDEGIVLFTNLGGARFNQQQLIRFPPIYGSSSFELDDFNRDGYADILYTCGDNADYSAIFKPYHGIYIFLNDGKNHFNQKYFFPVNGCYKAMAKDFDGDGDLDIASIAFFPDFARQPEESFVYLENLGNLSFKPYSFPGAESGRWLTMDVGDADGDGRPDIVLGNFSIVPSFIHGHADWKSAPPFILLKNISRQPY